MKFPFSILFLPDAVSCPLKATVTYSGWKATTRGEIVEFDLETTPLYIKTDSAIGSGEEGKVGLYTATGAAVGGVMISFSSTPRYALWYCVSWRNFPSGLPSETDKVWKITLSRTSGIRLVIHCNFVEVLNVLLGSSMCSNSGWNNYWGKEVDKIEFSTTHTAFDFYASQLLISPGTNSLSIK